MIGKPQWFARRKYTGWGFSPKTWQGWVYIIAMVLPLFFILRMKTFGTATIIFSVAWVVIFVFDFIHISLNMEKDEREMLHEAIAERNSLWVILAFLAGGMIYQATMGVIVNGVPGYDPVILVAIIAGLITKIISNLYLDKKD